MAPNFSTKNFHQKFSIHNLPPKTFQVTVHPIFHQQIAHFVIVLFLVLRRLEYEERNKKKEVKEMAAYQALQKAQGKI